MEEVLSLPVVPFEWYQGPVYLVAITNEGGTIMPWPTNKPCPGKPVWSFGRNRSEFEATHQYYISNSPHDPSRGRCLDGVLEAINRGREQVHIHTFDGEYEYYAIPWERFEDVTGELVEAFLFLDPERVTTYIVNSRIAKKAFEALAIAGEKIVNGEDALQTLIPYFGRYGFPEDEFDRPLGLQEGKESPLSPGTLLSRAKNQALLAFSCMKLWSHIERKEHTAIAEMASINEDHGGKFLSFMGEMNRIPISHVPQREDNMWRTYARNWLYSVVEQQIKTLYVTRIPKKENTFTIGVRPGGLQSAMWLHFAEKIYSADNPHEGMRQCKQGGKFHGCGKWYRPSGPDDRSHYCPECRARAGAQRVARYRARHQVTSQT